MRYETFLHLCDGIKVRTLTAALDYEMHELYDALSYSKYKLKARTHYGT